MSLVDSFRQQQQQHIVLLWPGAEGGEMEVVDVVQKCVNLMESIYWSQLQTRAYKTHCHDITLVVCKLWPTLVEALQKRNPNLCEMPGAEEVFDALKTELESALAIVNKCCAMRQFDKLIDQGQTKRFLTMIRENLFMRSREAYLYTMRVCPPKTRKKSPASSLRRPKTPSSIASGESTGRIRYADN